MLSNKIAFGQLICLSFIVHKRLVIKITYLGLSFPAPMAGRWPALAATAAP